MVKSGNKLIIGFLIAMCLTVALAIPALAYTYYASLTVSENGTASYDMLPIGFTVNNEWMADNGFMNTSGNDTRIESLSGTEYPHLVADNKTLFAIPVPQNSQTNLLYTLKNAAQQFFYLVFGYGGYFTVDDHATIEFGDNWTLAYTGAWIDTTATGENITYKEDAYRVYMDDTADNITAVIYGDNDTSPTGTVDPDAKWSNEPNAIDGDTGTAATTAGFNINNGAWSWYLIGTYPVQTIGTVRTYARINAGSSDNVDIDVWNIATDTWDSVYSGVFTASTWSEHTLDTPITSNQTRVRLFNGGGVPAIGSIYEIQYGLGAQVSIEATAAEHDVTIQQDSPFFSIGIDTTGDITPVSDSIALNLPLPQPECNAATFTSIDSNGLTATVTGATWTNQGYSFDGINDYISVVHDAALNPAGAFSIEAWVYPTATVANGGYIVSKGYFNDAGDNGEYLLYLTPNQTTITASFRKDNLSDTGGTIPVDLNTWGHVVATFEPGTAVKIYVNGVLDVTNTSGISTAPLNNTTNPLFIGDLQRAAPFGPFKGTIGEVRIYDRALSQTEVTQDYNATKLKYTGSGDISTTSTLESVADNANDIVVMGEAVPYASSVNITTGGTLRASYHPTSMILGTNLPNYTTPGSFNGTIYWGLLPAGVNATLGSFASISQPSIGSIVDTPTLDILPDAGGADWFVEPDTGAGGSLTTNPLRPLVTMISDNTTLSEILVWRFYGLAFVLLVLVATAKGVRDHLLVCGIATAGAVLTLVIMTVWPTWALVFCIMFVIGGIIAERSPSL